MALEYEVVEILRSPAAQQINFVAEDVKINRDVYNRLADKITWGQLHVVVNPAALRPGTDANYYYGDNTLTLSGNTIPRPYKQVVLHELTHAAIDDMNLAHRRGLHRTEGEAIAYIAEHLFARYILMAPPTKDDWRFYRVADAIAKKIEAVSPHCYKVTHAEIEKLRNAIGQHIVYYPKRGQLVLSNGIN